MRSENDVTLKRQVAPMSTDSPSNIQPVRPKVSIFIISFNQKDFIADAIESAVNQNYENLEVVVSDDGSTDGTSAIIAHWQSRYPERVKALLNNENVGVTRNCNRALRACTGEYITLMGGDDVLLPGKITAQVDWLEQNPDRVLCGHAVVHVNADGTRRPNANPPKVKEGIGPEAFIRGGMVIPGQTIMVRSNAIPQHGFDEAIPIASDLLFIIEVLSGGGKFGYLEEQYYKYRHRGDSVSTRYFEMLNDIERTFLITASRYPQYQNICNDSLIKHVMYFGGVRYLNVGNKKVARKRFIKAIQKKPLFLKAWLRLLQTL